MTVLFPQDSDLAAHLGHALARERAKRYKALLAAAAAMGVAYSLFVTLSELAMWRDTAPRYGVPAAVQGRGAGYPVGGQGTTNALSAPVPEDGAAMSVTATYDDAPVARAGIHSKWRGVLGRHDDDLADAASSLRGAENANASAWRTLIGDLQSLSAAQQIRKVHEFFNRFDYKKDSAAWQVQDYWTTPFELMERGGGDCEDIAVAKFLALRALGFPDDALRFVAVRDTARGGIAHAVILVRLKGKILVLDNLRQSVGTASDLSRYEPVYAVNVKSLWLYRGETQLFSQYSEGNYGTR